VPPRSPSICLDPDRGNGFSNVASERVSGHFVAGCEGPLLADRRRRRSTVNDPEGTLECPHSGRSMLFLDSKQLANLSPSAFSTLGTLSTVGADSRCDPGNAGAKLAFRERTACENVDIRKEEWTLRSGMRHSRSQTARLALSILTRRPFFETNQGPIPRQLTATLLRNLTESNNRDHARPADFQDSLCVNGPSIELPLARRCRCRVLPTLSGSLD
jgi:hypothetical protein